LDLPSQAEQVTLEFGAGFQTLLGQRGCAGLLGEVKRKGEG
jgi:hypothetical protein